MNLHFSKEDVRHHLELLGYKNISNDLLKDFMVDLKRLIRYEEKQNRIESVVQCPKRRRPRLATASSTFASSVSSNTSEVVSNGDLYKKSPKMVLQRREWKRVEESRNKPAMPRPSRDVDFKTCSPSVSMTREHVKVLKRTVVTPESSSYFSEESHSSVRVNIHIKPRNEEGLDEADGLETDDGHIKLLHKPCGETMTKQILPKRPTLPSKPSTSCIRRALKGPESKPLARDPVQLYNFYRKQWDNLKLPGDNSTKTLRWSVREWMLGDQKD